MDQGELFLLSKIEELDNKLEQEKTKTLSLQVKLDNLTERVNRITDQLDYT